MNNPRSMMLGWGCLTLAAGVAYVYARKDINERRKNQEALGVRPPERLDWQARIERDTSETSATEQTASSSSKPTS